MPKLQNYRVYWTKGTYNCATHQLATLTVREYMDVEATSKPDAMNTVFTELAEEMEWIDFYLVVDKDAPTYRGWEAYGRPNDKFRLDHGMAMSAERIYVFDNFMVKKRNEVVE